MVDLVLRGTKGSALTHAELDGNQTALNLGKAEILSAVPAVRAATDTIIVGGRLYEWLPDDPLVPDVGEHVLRSIKVYTAGQIPTADEGPIDVIGIGRMEWDSIDSAYVSTEGWRGVPVGAFIAQDTRAMSPPRGVAGLRYVFLTRNHAYNSGIVINESITGTAPRVNAFGYIDLPASPMHGLSIQMINTSRAFMRAGVNASLTVEFDTVQVHAHNINIKAGSGGGSAFGQANYGNGDGSQYGTEGTQTGNSGAETQPMNIRVPYFQRIL